MHGNITGELAQLWSHLHDISLSALAAAVITLGIVILLELRSVVQLRRVVDGSLARVFEQLDLLRYESQQLIEAQSQAPPPTAEPTPTVAQLAARLSMPPTGSTSGPASGSASPASTSAAPLTAGEARLLSSLAQARARRAPTEQTRV